MIFKQEIKAVNQERGESASKGFPLTKAKSLKNLFKYFSISIFLAYALFGCRKYHTLASYQEHSSVKFPVDSGVIDVTLAPYGAIPDDNKDDTAAIQKALNKAASSNHIIYLPAGTYIVSNRLNWPKDHNRSWLNHKRTILQGESRDRTIIKLQDNASDYQDPSNPQAVIWTGETPAQRFRNAIRDLTVNTGNNNPGAIGIQFIANNQGGIRNVAIISEDGEGQVGLDMKYTDEIGPLYVNELYVRGFDYGIQTYWQTASITFENITLENQNVLGWENFGQTIFIRGLKSVNAVTALKNVKNSPGSVTLIDANLVGTGDANNVPAILNQREMFLRNIQTSGYSMSVKHEDKGRGNEPGITESNIDEWVSHEQEQSGSNSPNLSLNLLIQNIPVIPWDNSNWISPRQFGGQPDDDIDDTDSIQAAIDSGATTVYLPNGVWNISGTLKLRGKVQRFVGTEASVVGNAAKIEFLSTSQPVVQIERMEMKGTVDIIHASEQILILSSLIMSGRYHNSNNGDLFIEDVVGGPFRFSNQNVWARQLNQETDTQATIDEAKIVNDGGNLWILGLKTERPGTIIQTINGGQTEVIGGFIYSTGAKKTEPAFINQESSLSLAGVVERNFNGNPFQIWLQETKNNETRTLSTEKQ